MLVGLVPLPLLLQALAIVKTEDLDAPLPSHHFSYDPHAGFFFRDETVVGDEDQFKQDHQHMEGDDYHNQNPHHHDHDHEQPWHQGGVDMWYDPLYFDMDPSGEAGSSSGSSDLPSFDDQAGWEGDMEGLEEDDDDCYDPLFLPKEYLQRAISFQVPQATTTTTTTTTTTATTTITTGPAPADTNGSHLVLPDHFHPIWV